MRCAPWPGLQVEIQLDEQLTGGPAAAIGAGVELEQLARRADLGRAGLQLLHQVDVKLAFEPAAVIGAGGVEREQLQAALIAR